MEIVELRSAVERREALPILRELYPSLDEERYAGLLADMLDTVSSLCATRPERSSRWRGWLYTSTSTMGVTSTSTTWW